MTWYLMLFGLGVLGVWSYLDAKHGQASAYWIFIPVGIGFFLSPWPWVKTFLPVFAVTLLIYLALLRVSRKGGKKTGFGLWDVVAAPFLVWLLVEGGILLMAIAPMAIGIQILLYDRLPRFLVPKRLPNGFLKLLPVIFNAFLVGLFVQLAVQAFI